MSSSTLRIRTYRSSDYSVARKVFSDAINEPGMVAFNFVMSHLEPWTIWGMGMVAVVGLPFMTSQRPPLRYLATASAIWSASWLAWVRQKTFGSYWDYSQNALCEDMARIPEHYQLHAIDESNKDDIVYAASGPKNFFICEDQNGNLAGMVALDFHDKDKRTGEVRRMVVSKTHRRMGVANVLLKALVTHAVKNDIQVIDLGTSEVQYAARKLYEKFGWKEAKRLKNELYLIDVIIYTLNIEKSLPPSLFTPPHNLEHAIASA
ncbi:N-acetyltransferase 8 [Umbelopsis sp. WA50703]